MDDERKAFRRTGIDGNIAPRDGDLIGEARELLRHNFFERCCNSRNNSNWRSSRRRRAATRPETKATLMLATTANIVTVQASFAEKKAKLNAGARNKYQPISTERTV